MDFDEVDYEKSALRFMRDACISRVETPKSYRPSYDETDIQGVIRVLKNESVWRSDSEACQRLIESFRRNVNPCAYSLPVSSATAGLHTVLTYFLRKGGRYVLVPSYTWYSVAASVLNSGGIPLFWDLARDSLRLSTKRPDLTGKQVACCVVSHLFGIPALSGSDIAWLSENGIPLIEDCAQTVFGRDGDVLVGQIGNAAIYSFNGSKHIPAGEGGMICTDDREIAIFCKSFVMTVHSPKSITIKRFDSNSEGWNYRLGAIYAALAESLIEKLQIRREQIYLNSSCLKEILMNFPFLKMVDKAPANDRMYLGLPVLVGAHTDSATDSFVLRNTLYFILRHSGIICSVWVDEPIQCTALLTTYFARNRIIPDPRSYEQARRFANQHIVFSNLMKPTTDQTEATTLIDILQKVESFLLSRQT